MKQRRAALRVSLAKLLSAVAIVASPLFARAASDTVSQEKVVRVIRVSGAYFDLVPPSEPLVDTTEFTLGSMISFLPKIDEPDLIQDMPSVHGIPLLRSSFRLTRVGDCSVVQSVTAGTLISGLERLFGVTAKPRQWLLGTSVGLLRPGTITHGGVFAGIQHVRTSISGVEFPVPSDIVTASSLIFAGVSAELNEVPFWIGATVGKKSTDIVVKSDDQVLLADTDTLSDSSMGEWLEGSAGYTFREMGLSVGISELWVPDRLLMLRVVGRYSLELSTPD